eukprot:12746439-Heterocapsa_arctica.AAC.1
MICEIAEVRDLHPGVCICKAGTVAESAWLCMAGRLKATKPGSESKGAEFMAEHVVNEKCLTSADEYLS